MTISKFVLHTDDNMTVEKLMELNAKLGGKNYLDLDSGDIVTVEDAGKGETLKEIISEKKPGKKK